MLGQIAVTHVVLNRTRNPKRFGSTPKEVIQKEAQFSWYEEGKPLPPIEEYPALEKALLSVIIAETERYLGIDLQGADHYHRYDIDPDWNDNMKFITRIGDHIFWQDT